MRVSIIGTGYVGLVAAAVFADYGNDVLCADINGDKVSALRRGELPIYEPGLEGLVERNTAAGRLRFTTSNAEAAAHGEVIFLAVGTPSRDSGGGVDLTAMLAAAVEVAKGLTKSAIIVNKSTVPVGTAERVERVFVEHSPHSVVVVSNPEFLKEGSAVDDFMHPSRVIIGTSDEAARKTMARLYSPFCRVSDRMLFMDARSAELTKYACNAYLAARISFINDIANLSDAVGADVEKVRKGMGSDPRIGRQFLYPGVGYGGSCFPKDTRALLDKAREYGMTLEIVASAERINAAQKLVLPRKVRAHWDGALVDKTFALWGLAFKPNTDDIREAPSLRIAEALLSEGARLRLHDPIAGPNFVRALGDKSGAVELCDDPYDAARGADGLLLVTEWRQFRSPDFRRLAGLMRAPVLFDGRNQWERAHVESLGFTYYGIGR